MLNGNWFREIYVELKKKYFIGLENENSYLIIEITN